MFLFAKQIGAGVHRKQKFRVLNVVKCLRRGKRERSFITFHNSNSFSFGNHFYDPVDFHSIKSGGVVKPSSRIWGANLRRTYGGVRKLGWNAFINKTFQHIPTQLLHDKLSKAPFFCCGLLGC